MKRRKSVALLIETSNAYARGLLEGILKYYREHDAWSIYIPEQELGAAPPVWLKNTRIDGAIAVPEQIAVIGVDNDPILCELARPSLTSIAPDAVGAGCFAARWLDQAMTSRTCSKRSDYSAPFRLMPPLGLILRQSTSATTRC